MGMDISKYLAVEARLASNRKRVEFVEAQPLKWPLVLTINGQIRGGKNNMVITRSGHRFPKKEWSKWRDESVRSLKCQLPKEFVTIGEQAFMRLDYFAEDHRRRDMPAILDSIFHCLEKAGVVQDDTLLWVCQSTRAYDKMAPRAEIQIWL